MNSITILLMGFGLLACNAPTKAQDEQKLRKDHTYSTHNYKHPNKAAAARRWENRGGIVVQTPAPQDTRLANYKNQLPGQQPVGGVTVPHRPDESLANRNYKMQKPAAGTVQDGSLARKRAKDRPDTTGSATGD